MSTPDTAVLGTRAVCRPCGQGIVMHNEGWELPWAAVPADKRDDPQAWKWCSGHRTHALGFVPLHEPAEGTIVDRPNPGTIEARERGCACVVLDADAERYRLRDDCPLHGGNKLTLTDRAGLSHD